MHSAGRIRWVTIKRYIKPRNGNSRPTAQPEQGPQYLLLACAMDSTSSPLDLASRHCTAFLNGREKSSMAQRNPHRHRGILNDLQEGRPVRILTPNGVRKIFGVWREAASRSQSAPHMHVLVCICSNVRQFIMLIIMIHIGAPSDVWRLEGGGGGCPDLSWPPRRFDGTT